MKKCIKTKVTWSIERSTALESNSKTTQKKEKKKRSPFIQEIPLAANSNVSFLERESRKP